jgi:ABC-type transporter Mla MlaB component
VVFDAEGMSHIDAAGLAALEELSDSLSGEGIGLASRA